MFKKNDRFIRFKFRIIIFLKLSKNYDINFFEFFKMRIDYKINVEGTTVNYKQLDYKQLGKVMLGDITMSARQNIRNIIFVIVSCCSIYSVLSPLCIRQGRVLAYYQVLVYYRILTYYRVLAYYLPYLFS